MGAMWVGQQPGGAKPAPYVVTNSSNWVYAGTGLHDGDEVPGIVGYEADQYMPDQPQPTAVNGTYVRLSHSPFTSALGPTVYQESTIYRAPSGAWVFDAGAIDWPWALYNDEQRVADPRLQRMTANVLNAFTAGPSAPAPGH